MLIVFWPIGGVVLSGILVICDCTHIYLPLPGVIPHLAVFYVQSLHFTYSRINVSARACKTGLLPVYGVKEASP